MATTTHSLTLRSGIHRGPVHLAELPAQGAAALPDPAALLHPAATPTAGTVVLRHDGAGFAPV
jgi:hypothetical protein